MLLVMPTFFGCICSSSRDTSRFYVENLVLKHGWSFRMGGFPAASLNRIDGCIFPSTKTRKKSPPTLVCVRGLTACRTVSLRVTAVVYGTKNSAAVVPSRLPVEYCLLIFLLLFFFASHSLSPHIFFSLSFQLVRN